MTPRSWHDIAKAPRGLPWLPVKVENLKKERKRWRLDKGKERVAISAATNKIVPAYNQKVGTR